MKVLYYDCFSGISGDMNLGAMVDLGVPKEYLIEELNKLSIKSEFKLEVGSKNKMGIQGTKVDVILTKNNYSNSSHHQHKHSHNHKKHKHTHDRGLKEVREIIENSILSEAVKNKSMEIFMEIAKAEALVHGKPIDKVHFHEVGAVDSIVDIVGAAICLDYLNVDEIMASHIELGKGFVKCAHGLIPVPAPATIEILKDVPVKMGKVQGETTTPTGAAILKVNVKTYTDTPNLTVKKVAYGLGTKDFDIPNVLRVYLAEKKTS